MSKPLFITESSKECHLPNFDVEVLAFVFIPNVNIKSDEFYYPTIANMQEICESDRIIILAHDCDEKGQLMSSLLYYSFLNMGVDNKRLIRMPLTGQGIGYIGSFYTEAEMKKLKDYYILERLYMNKYKTIGFKKSIILKHLYHLSLSRTEHRVVNKNKNGTNTITHITKKLLGEL